MNRMNLMKQGGVIDNLGISKIRSIGIVDSSDHYLYEYRRTSGIGHVHFFYRYYLEGEDPANAQKEVQINQSDYIKASFRNHIANHSDTFFTIPYKQSDVNYAIANGYIMLRKDPVTMETLAMIYDPRLVEPPEPEPEPSDEIYIYYMTFNQQGTVFNTYVVLVGERPESEDLIKPSDYEGYNTFEEAKVDAEQYGSSPTTRADVEASFVESFEILTFKRVYKSEPEPPFDPKKWEEEIRKSYETGKICMFPLLAILILLITYIGMVI